MSDTSAYAPYVASYGQADPYLTTDEYVNAPTAIDVANLLAGGNAEAQTTSLKDVIGRASSMIDAACLGAFGTLNATVNTENGQVWGNRFGQLIVHPKYWPILEVRSFSYGFNAGLLSSLTPAGNAWIEPARFIMQASGVVGLGLGAPSGIGPAPYLCEWEYVNGWPNTPLAASVTAADTSFYPSDTTGIYPGSPLTVYDLPNQEDILVDASYVPGAAQVPLASPFLFDHAAGVPVSNLPQAAKQAAIALTTCLVKQRGSGALIASDIGEVKAIADSGAQGSRSDFDQAMDCIRQLKSNFVGY